MSWKFIVSAPDGQYYGHTDEYGEAGTIEGPSIDEIQKMILEQEYKKASQTADNEDRQQQDENQPQKTEVEYLKSKIRGIIDQKHLQLQEQINQIEQVLTLSTHKDTTFWKGTFWKNGVHKRQKVLFQNS